MIRDRASIRADLELLGVPADEAEQIAAADMDGATPQLVRHAVLAAAWRHVVDPDGAWIEAHETAVPMNEPLEALLAAGVDRVALTRLVRAMQFELLAGMCELLDDGRDRVTAARWRLFEVDDAGRPARPVVALHESVTSSDPTGEADGWM